MTEAKFCRLKRVHVTAVGDYVIGKELLARWARWIAQTAMAALAGHRQSSFLWWIEPNFFRPNV